MIPFTETPGEAVPDKELLDLLKKITEVEGNEIVLISGRDKETLQKWLGELPVDFVAEHGAWFKERRRNGKIKSVKFLKYMLTEHPVLLLRQKITLWSGTTENPTLHWVK